MSTDSNHAAVRALLARGGDDRAQPRASRRSYRPLIFIAVLCTAPVVASYVAYYLAPPSGRTNYGELVLPQRSAPTLALRTLSGAPYDLHSLRGQWVLLQVDRGACAEACQGKLWNMRQVRLTTGRERERVARVALLVDETPLAADRLRDYDGTVFARADERELQRFLLPPERAGVAGNDNALADHIWIIDPLGNLMLRWPKNADPNRMKKDLARLLAASRIG